MATSKPGSVAGMLFVLAAAGCVQVLGDDYSFAGGPAAGGGSAQGGKASTGKGGGAGAGGSALGAGGSSPSVGGSSPGAGGSSPGTGGSGTGGSGAGTGAGGMPGLGDCTPLICQEPPSDPMKGMGDGTATNVQAFTKIFMGDTDRQGVAKSNAWQIYGFPLSGKIYNDASTGAATHCKPQDGAKPADVIINGTNGVDNSFGKNFWPILLGLASDAGQKIQDSITSGAFSAVIGIDKLGAGVDYSGLSGNVYPAHGTLDAMGAPIAPVDWTSYAWHATAAGAPFSGSYLANNTWVSGPLGQSQVDLLLTLSFSGYDLPLLIHHATIAMTFAPDHKTATNGNIGGVLATEDLVAAIKSIAGSVSSSLCSGTALDGVLAQVRQASDIMLDGTQNPSAVCNGVSIGLGFETTKSTLGAAAAATTPKNPCK